MMESPPALALASRGRECSLRYEYMLERRSGVREHVERLETSVAVESISTLVEGTREKRPVARMLAVLVRGQAFRGIARDTFETRLRSQSAKHQRVEAQATCLSSLRQRLIDPYEAGGHRVDVFLTTYKALGGPMKALLAPLGRRVVSITTILSPTPTQLLPLGVALKAFVAWCSAHGQRYAAVVVTRFDLFLKTNLQALLGDADKIDGFRFLWREAGGDWRQYTNRRAANRRFATGLRRPENATGRSRDGHAAAGPAGAGGLVHRTDWRRGNRRIPDALLAFPFAYASCFQSAVRNELFPSGDMAAPLGFLHNMLVGLMRALPWTSGEPARYAYLLRGQFDSNPCRTTCMLNPIYDLLPRMQWVAESNICQRIDDFVYDATSDSICCPSPNYCCPNSVSHCREPGAVLFDAQAAGTSGRAIGTLWPRFQSAPIRWEMTPRSSAYVATVWREEMIALEGGNMTTERGGRPASRSAQRAARLEARRTNATRRRLTAAIQAVVEDGEAIAALPWPVAWV